MGRDFAGGECSTQCGAFAACLTAQQPADLCARATAQPTTAQHTLLCTALPASSACGPLVVEAGSAP